MADLGEIVMSDFVTSEIHSQIVEILTFQGHENIRGYHRNTLELTMDSEISRRADCIIGVNSDKACAQLSSGLKNQIMEGLALCFELKVNDETFKFFGRGSKDLTLEDAREIVLRKSDFASPRTAAIKCTSAAIDIPRHMIQMLKNPLQQGSLSISSSGLASDDDFASLCNFP